MKSIFGRSPIKQNTQQENNLTARKPQISHRKPLGDIRIGENVSKSFLKEKPAKVVDEIPQISSILPGKYEQTPPPQNMVFEPQMIENGTEFNYKYLLDNFSENSDAYNSSASTDFDICSYKVIPENYNDLMGPAEISEISSILSGQLEKTPPPKKKSFEPQLIENWTEFNYKFISGENISNFPENIKFYDSDENVPFPELNFEL